VRLRSLNDKYDTIAGAYQLWNEGVVIPVTFNPKLFDEHPSTLRLLSYSDDLFDQLLEAVETPKEHDLPNWIVRLVSEDHTLCSYYGMAEIGAKPILGLTNLESALAQEAPPFDPDRLDEVQADFNKRIEDIKHKDYEIKEIQKRAEEDALLERGRHLLLEATYIDLAMARYLGLLEQPPNLAGFTEDAVKALKRCGYPFAPLLRLVGTENITPIPSDPTWARVQDASHESLKKKLEAIKKSIADLLHKLKPQVLEED